MDRFQIGLLAVGIAVLCVVGVFWLAGLQEGKLRGVKRGCEMAVAVHASGLTDQELFDQIQNHWESDMLARLDKILSPMSPWDLIMIQGVDWFSVYEKHHLDREQRAVLDEWLEDCANICA